MKRFLQVVSMLMLVSTLCAFIAAPANALFDPNYTGAENTFDIYDSHTKKALTSGNSGITMHSEQADGTDGWMYIHSDINIGGYQFHDGDRIFYHIVGVDVKDKGEIHLSFSEGDNYISISGKVHTYQGKSSFISITKIDGLGGGQYMKYTKSTKNAK